MNYSQPTLSEHQDKISELKIGLISAGLSHMGAREAAHSKLVRSGVAGAEKELIALGVKSENIYIVEVPGVLEIPFAANRLIKAESLDGLVGLALIVEGGVYHHEFVAQNSLDALMKVSMDTDTPIASGLLTPVTPKSPEVEFDMLFEHLSNKGLECSRALVGQIIQMNRISK